MATQLGEELAQADCSLGIEAGGRFVEHEDLWGHGEDAGECDATPFAPAQREGLARPEFFQRHVYHVECACHEAIDALGSKAEIARPKGHILGHGFGEELEFGKLEGQADALAHASRRLGADVAAVEEHATARGFEQGVEVLGEGGLARAVGAHEGQYGASGDVYINVANAATLGGQVLVVEVCQFFGC